MKKNTHLRPSILVAVMLITALAACDKPEQRENNAGTESDPPETDNPCLRMNLLETESEEPDADDEEKEENDSKKEEINEESGVGSSTSNSGCDKEPVVKENTKTDQKKPSKGSGIYDVGPGIDGCEAKSEAWIAVKNGGPGVCEGTLVKYCCSADEIALRFPTVSAKLGPKIKAKSKKLYHCSEKDGKTIFHFAASTSSGADYETLFVGSTASKEGDTKGENCPVVTMKDLGFKDKTEKTEKTDTAIPKIIGEIEDTSKAGILAFLKAKKYQTWRGDTAIRDVVPHGKVKIFYNQKLEKSLKDGKDEHEVGSIAVREIYKGTVIDGYALLGKHKTGKGKETWFFYESGGTDFSDIKAHAVGSPASCAECHTKGKDFIQSKMLNP